MGLQRKAAIMEKEHNRVREVGSDIEQRTAQDGLRQELWEAQDEANRTIMFAEQVLYKAAKQLEKEEKRLVGNDISELRERLAKIRADQLTAEELLDLRSATEQLRSSDPCLQMNTARHRKRRRHEYV